MPITLENAAELKEEQVLSMLELDSTKALAFVEEEIKLMEEKHGFSTAEMLKKYETACGNIESWLEDWHDLVIMRKDLHQNNDTNTAVRKTQT